MADTISKKISVHASAAKPLVKPPPGDKTLGLEPAIRFYSIEDGDETEEVEEAEILVIHNSSLKLSKKILVKRKFIFINMFSHEGPAVINSMHDRTVVLFKHLEVTSKLDLNQMIKYMDHILRGLELKKFRQVLLECKKLVKGLAVYQWSMGLAKSVTVEQF